MGWLITGGILLLLAVLPLGVHVTYDERGVLVKVIAGPIRFTIYPPKKKEPKKEEPKPTPQPQQKRGEEENLPKPPQPPGQSSQQDTKKKGGSFTDFLPLIRIALDFLGDFRRKLRLEDLYLRLIMAGGDPCELAVNYGRAWAAVGNLMSQLERLFVIKKRDIEVECDFTATQTTVIARIQATITLGRLLALAAVYGVRALLAFFKIKKGGAEK